MDNSIVCAEHAREAVEVWGFIDNHNIGIFCTWPGSEWLSGEDGNEGQCVLPVEDEMVAVISAAQVLVTP